MTSQYAAAGTAASESFWSVSDSLPSDCTGFDTKTRPVPVDDPDPGFAAATDDTTMSASSCCERERPHSH